MEITTVAGVAIRFICICVSILFDGSLDAFINGPSVLIVVGGTIAATIVAYPLKTLNR